MAGRDRSDPPKPSRADFAHTLARAGLSAIPVVGGPAAEPFSALIVPPLAKRRDEWIQSIGKGLEELQARIEGFSMGALRDNPAFITAVMHATQAAIRNHQQEKLESLRNAVLNVASGNAPNEDLQLMFLNCVDTFTPWHLRVLRFFQNPAAFGEAKTNRYPSWQMGGPSTVLEFAFKELTDNRSSYDQVVRDLHSRGLLNTDVGGLHTTMTAQGMFAKRTTPTGDAFIDFVTSPVRSFSRATH